MPVRFIRPEAKVALTLGGPLVAVLVAALFFLSAAVDDLVDIQIADASRNAERELAALVRNAGDESATLASSDIVAGAMDGDTGPALTMLRDLLKTTLFDDLYLIDPAGQVVHMPDPEAGAGGQAADQGALKDMVAQVMDRTTQGHAPAEVVILGQPASFDQGPGVLLGRPLLRQGQLAGVVIARLPLRRIEERLSAVTRPGIGFALLDAAGTAVINLPGAGQTADWEGRELAMPPDTKWRCLVLSDAATLAGGRNHIRWWLLLAGFVSVGPFMRVLRVRTPERPPALEVIPVTLPPGVQNGDHIPMEGDDHAGPLDSDEGYRRTIVDVMTLALECWQKGHRKGKIELAEESGLWRVYMDRSSPQTRTLDKYLLLETLPRHPRWRDVVRTADYVLRRCAGLSVEREALSAGLGRLKQYLRQVERI